METSHGIKHPKPGEKETKEDLRRRIKEYHKGALRLAAATRAAAGLATGETVQIYSTGINANLGAVVEPRQESILNNSH